MDTKTVMDFLSEFDDKKHNETYAELLRRNFGMSWALAYEYEKHFIEEKEKDNAL